MPKKFFSYDEINELVPQLEYHFRQLLLHKKEMAKTSLRLKKMGYVSELIGDLPPGLDPKIRELYDQCRGHYQGFKRHVLAIEGLGGEIKDFELGRVVFYSHDAGEETRLVWQLGVTEVVHREVASGNSRADYRDLRVVAEPLSNET